MADLDLDRILALSYVPAARRAAVGALWRLDVALGAVLASGREPLISRIKLAWWRDSLAALGERGPPAEPVLEGVAAHVVPNGPGGADLAGMEEGWSLLLAEQALTADELAGYARARGGLLFRYSAELLGGPTDEAVERGGEAWALVDLARHSNDEDAGAALAAARERLPLATRWPGPLRPLGMLVALAERDAGRGAGRLEPHGTPARAARMLRHRLTGN